jgi:hypothetical protein
MRVSPRTKNPERNQNANETSDMQTENHSLHQWKVLGQEGVEKGDKEHNRNGEESSVPSLVDVAVVVENNEPLNLDCR